MISNLAFHTTPTGRFVAADSQARPTARAVITLFDGTFHFAHVLRAEHRIEPTEADAIARVVFVDLARAVTDGVSWAIEDEDVLMDLVALYFAWLNPAPVRLVQDAYCLSYANSLGEMADTIRGIIVLNEVSSPRLFPPKD